MTSEEWVRRYVFVMSHPEKYRRAARQEFHVPLRVETEWTAMVSRFVERITRALATGGRLE
jgi:hypothetical protein